MKWGLAFLGLILTSALGNAGEGSLKPVYDFSALAGKRPSEYGLCSSSYGAKIKMLGVAFVYEGPGNGRAVFGHVGERFIYCFDQEVVDILYDYVPFDSEWLGRLSAVFEDQYDVKLSAFSPLEIDSLKKSLYVNQVSDPVPYFASEEAVQNRNLYEVWLRADQTTIYKMLQANIKRFKEQSRQIQDHEPLSAYDKQTNNCMKPVLEDLRLLDKEYFSRFDSDQMTPRFLYQWVVGGPAAKIIVYPSQRLFRILRLKEQGQSAIQEKIVPLSEASPQRGQSWKLVYPEADNPSAELLVTPVAGAVNAGTSLAQMVYGLGSAPFKRNLKDFKSGAKGLVNSLGEILEVPMSYPPATSWTAEEVKYFGNFSPAPAVVNSLSITH